MDTQAVVAAALPLTAPGRNGPGPEDTRLAKILVTVGHPPRPSTSTKKLLKAHKDWIVRFVAELPSPKLAGEILGVSTSCIKEHRRSDPSFRAAYDDAIRNGRTVAAGLVYEEAHGVGLDHVVVKTPDGAEVLAIPKRRSERLLELIYRLEHAPEFQTHNLNVTGDVAPGTMTISVTPEQLGKLSRDERRQLTQLLRKVESFAPKTLEHQP